MVLVVDVDAGLCLDRGWWCERMEAGLDRWKRPAKDEEKKKMKERMKVLCKCPIEAERSDSEWHLFDEE